MPVNSHENRWRSCSRGNCASRSRPRFSANRVILEGYSDAKTGSIGMGVPVPAYPTLIVAGAFAQRGGPGLPELLLLSVGACLAADGAWFWLGRRFGIRVLRTLCRISLEPDSCVSQTQIHFETWGVSALLIAKFVPGLSIIAPPLAGALRIRWSRFLVLSAAGFGELTLRIRNGWMASIGNIP